MIYCRCSIHKHIVQNESTRGKTKIILLTLEMARQEVSRTTHIQEGELRVTHENAILTNITGHSIFNFHCIIHQQVLCAKTAFKSLQEIMNVVTKLINLISARAFNKRKFQQLLTVLSDMDSMHGGLQMYNSVRWLSREKVLQRFVECLNEIILFLNNRKNS